MKGKLFKTLYNFITSGAEGSVDSENIRKIVLINILSAITIVICICLCTIDLIKGLYLISIIGYSLSVFLFSVIVLLRYTKNYFYPGNSLVVIYLLFSTAMLYTGGSGNSGYLWFYVFPGLAYFILGKQKGTVFIIVSIGVSVVILNILPAYNSYLDYTAEYSEILKARFFITYISVSFLSFVVEITRDNSHRLQLSTNQKVSQLLSESLKAQKIIQSQNEELDEKNKNILDSIFYAKRIQEAVLPTREHLNEILKDYFIFFQPRDIVSGDFYWAFVHKEVLYCAVVDCTGHGVPGALMSILGNAFLNEIIEKNETKNPALVLNILRQYIIKSLKQKGIFEEQKDGMDISLVILDTIPEKVLREDGNYQEVFNMSYAGANNPAWVIRKKSSYHRVIEGNSKIIVKQATHATELIELIPDKMPIGIHEKLDNFAEQKLQLFKGDILYLFSDGYADQFGGIRDKKFKYTQLRKLLVSISDQPMNEQYDILKKMFNEWKGFHKQTDDVTVMGIKMG